jgi:hypothetical protein
MKNWNWIILFIFCTTNLKLNAAAIYYHPEEYGKIDSVGIVDIKHVNYLLMITRANGEKDFVSLKESKIWGFRNQWGEDYRIEKPKTSWRILEYGAISVYTKRSAQSTVENPEITPGNADQPYRLDKTYRFSSTPSGEMIKYSRKRFLKSLEDRPELRKKFLKILNEQPVNVLLYIMKYNAGQWEEEF